MLELCSPAEGGGKRKAAFSASRQQFSKSASFFFVLCRRSAPSKQIDYTVYFDN
jgi:hypothetical protein